MATDPNHSSTSSLLESKQQHQETNKKEAQINYELKDWKTIGGVETAEDVTQMSQSKDSSQTQTKNAQIDSNPQQQSVKSPDGDKTSPCEGLPDPPGKTFSSHDPPGKSSPEQTAVAFQPPANRPDSLTRKELEEDEGAKSFAKRRKTFRESWRRRKVGGSSQEFLLSSQRQSMSTVESLGTMESATMESHPTMDSLATMESLAVSCRDEAEGDEGQQRRGSKLAGGGGNGQNGGEKRMGEAKKKFTAKGERLSSRIGEFACGTTSAKSSLEEGGAAQDDDPDSPGQIKFTSLIQQASIKLNYLPKPKPAKEENEFEDPVVLKVTWASLASPIHLFTSLYQHYTNQNNRNNRPQAATTSFQSRGQVSNDCLWHACRAITLGTILIITGLTLAILGYLSDQKEYHDHIEMSRKNSSFANPKYKDGRFHLNNMSFAGPVVMGVGGFLIVAACVMTLEARDNTGKVVPASGSTNSHHPELRHTIVKKTSKFQSSASQTTFIDGDILAVLTESSTISRRTSCILSQSSNIKKLSCSSSQLPTTQQPYQPSAANPIPGLTSSKVDLTASNRQALTQAFINREEEMRLLKCPSAPCIPSINIQDFRSVVVGSIQTNNSSASDQRGGASKFRLLTPTLYRSQMAKARQTVSMDCGEENQTRKGYLLPDKQDDSFDLELGASASGVTGRKSSRNSSRQNSSRRYSESSESSLRLDLHVEGNAPVTLLVRDESRSAKSYEPAPLSPLSPFLTRKVRSASPCGGYCCPKGATANSTSAKQVSFGSTSSLNPSPTHNNMKGDDKEWWISQSWKQTSLKVPPPPGILRTSPTPPNSDQQSYTEEQGSPCTATSPLPLSSINNISSGSPTLIEETGRESSTPIDQTDENSITSADTVKVIIDSVNKLDGCSTPKTENGSERVVEGRDDNVCITIDEIMEGISYADQSSEEPSEKSDMCATLTEDMRYTISFDPGALDSTPSESEKSTSYSINEEILIAQCREFMSAARRGSCCGPLQEAAKAVVQDPPLVEPESAQSLTSSSSGGEQESENKTNHDQKIKIVQDIIDSELESLFNLTNKSKPTNTLLKSDSISKDRKNSDSIEKTVTLSIGEDSTTVTENDIIDTYDVNDITDITGGPRDTQICDKTAQQQEQPESKTQPVKDRISPEKEKQSRNPEGTSSMPAKSVEEEMIHSSLDHLPSPPDFLEFQEQFMFECANFPSPPELYQNPPSPPPPPPMDGDEDTGMSGSIYEDFTTYGSGGGSNSSPVLSDSSPPYTEALESLSSERTRLGSESPPTVLYAHPSQLHLDQTPSPQTLSCSPNPLSSSPPNLSQEGNVGEVGKTESAVKTSLSVRPTFLPKYHSIQVSESPPELSPDSESITYTRLQDNQTASTDYTRLQDNQSTSTEHNLRIQNPLELHKLSIDTQLTLEKIAEGQNLASCPQEEWMSEQKDPESLELFKSRKHKQIRGDSESHSRAGSLSHRPKRQCYVATTCETSMKQSKKSQACPGISETQQCPNTEAPSYNKSSENAHIPKTEESVHCPKVSEISHNSCERSETSQRSQHKQDTGPWQEYLTSSTSHSSGEAKPQEFSSYQGQGRTQEYSRSQGQGSSAEDFRTNKSMDNSNTKRERPVFHQEFVPTLDYRTSQDRLRTNKDSWQPPHTIWQDPGPLTEAPFCDARMYEEEEDLHSVYVPPLGSPEYEARVTQANRSLTVTTEPQIFGSVYVPPLGSPRYPEYDLALAAAQVYLPELQRDRYTHQDDIQAYAGEDDIETGEIEPAEMSPERVPPSYFCTTSRSADCLQIGAKRTVDFTGGVPDIKQTKHSYRSRQRRRTQLRRQARLDTDPPLQQQSTAGSCTAGSYRRGSSPRHYSYHSTEYHSSPKRRESAPRRSLRGNGGRDAGWCQEREETEGEMGEDDEGEGCDDRLNLAAADPFSSDVQLDDLSPTIHFIETFSDTSSSPQPGLHDVASIVRHTQRKRLSCIPRDSLHSWSHRRSLSF